MSLRASAAGLLSVAMLAVASGCTEPKLDAAPPGFCPAVKVSTSLSFVPPPYRASQCSMSQLADFRTLCFEPATADQTACAAWSARNASCFNCAFSSKGDSKWGAVVALNKPGEIDFANIGGCIAAMSPKDVACGKATQAQLQCMLASCDSCQVGSSSAYTERLASVDSLNSCFDSALAGPCAAYANAATECQSGLDPAVAAACARSDRDFDGLFRVIGVMCGSATTPAASAP